MKWSVTALLVISAALLAVCAALMWSYLPNISTTANSSSVTKYPVAKLTTAIDAVQRFNLAAKLKPWERSPLSSRTDLPALRAALLAKCSDEEVKAWERFSRKYGD